MNEPKFTKGPWYVNCQEAIYCDKYKGFFIASAHRMYDDERPEEEVIEEAKANAALMATSPKLYKKLHDILEQQCGECCSTVDVGDIRGKTPCEKGETCPYGMDDVKALLAEARGEE